MVEHEGIAIENGIGKLRNPVAQYRNARSGTEHQIEHDVAMAEDKIIDVRVYLQIVLGKKYERLLVFAHVVGFFSIDSLHATVLGPVQSESHAPSRMKTGEEAAQKAAVENGTEAGELPIAIAKSVAVGQIKRASHDFRGEGGCVDRYAAFFMQIVIDPQVVVAGKEVDFDALVGQFRELAEEAGVALGNYGAELIPEVEHVAQQIDAACIVADVFKEVHEPTFLRATVRNGQGAEMGIGYEIGFLHEIRKGGIR